MNTATLNPVQVDGAALAAEAERIAAEFSPEVDPLPPVDGAPLTPEISGKSPAAAAAEWRQFMPGLVTVSGVVLLPQWELKPAEQAELSSALADCCAQLFPDGLDGKYACWFRLVACIGAIGVQRYAHHGRLPGFGPAKKATGAAASASS